MRAYIVRMSQPPRRPFLRPVLLAAIAVAPLAAGADDLDVPRYTVARAQRGLALEGGAFGAAFGAAITGIPMTLAGGGDLRVPVVVACLSGVVGGIAGVVSPRTRGARELRPGDEVRTVSGEPIQGALRRIESSGLVLRLANGEDVLVPAAAGRFEVRRATRLTAVGAVVGGLVTFTGVWFIHAVVCDGCSGAPPAAVFAMGAGGALAGAGLGALVRVYDWRAAERESPAAPRGADANPRRQVSFRIGPMKGLGVSGQIAFRWR